MPLLDYKIYITAEATLTVKAAKINTGLRRLWFFDEDNHLLALFKWDHIVGFKIVGSADGQVLTDLIPIEMGTIPDEELGMEGRRSRQLFQQQLARSSEDDDFPL